MSQVYVGNGSGGGGGGSYYSLTPYIVGPDIHSQYATIGAAITAAIAAGASSTAPANIYIKPQSGGYTENPVLADGINLVGFGQQTTINGKVSLSGVATASVMGLTLSTSGDYAVEVTGNAATILKIANCNFALNSNNGIHISSTGGANVFVSFSYSTDAGGNAFFVQTGTNSLSIFECNFSGPTSVSNCTVASGCAVDIEKSIFGYPIVSASGSSFVDVINSSLYMNATGVTALTINGTSGNNNIYSSIISSNTGSAISIGAGAQAIVSNCPLVSSNANVITGSGTLFYAFIAFPGSSSGVNVTTTTPLATLI